MTAVEALIKQKYASLNKTERKIADYFLGHQDTVFQLPIAALALQSGVSQAAWVRFSKTLGYTGLKDLKKGLFSDRSTGTEAVPSFADIRDYPDLESMVRALRGNSMQAVEDTAKVLNLEVVDAVVTRILRADTIRLFGVGASAMVAEDFSTKLTRIGKANFFHRDIHFQLAYAANAAPGDVALLISHSGATKEVLEMEEVARRAGACTVSLTRVENNPLARSSSMQLCAATTEIHHRSGAMSSRIAQLFVVDILFTAIANRDYDAVVEQLKKSQESCRNHRVPVDQPDS